MRHPFPTHHKKSMNSMTLPMRSTLKTALHAHHLWLQHWMIHTGSPFFMPAIQSTDMSSLRLKHYPVECVCGIGPLLNKQMSFESCTSLTPILAKKNEKTWVSE
jgi:hypothetical protein